MKHTKQLVKNTLIVAKYFSNLFIIIIKFKLFYKDL